MYEISEKFFSNNGPVVEYSQEDNEERILRTLIEDLEQRTGIPKVSN